MPRIRKPSAGSRLQALGTQPAVVRDDELLTTQEAAALTKMSVAWFQRARWERKGPPYFRIGRSIRYLHSDLTAWWSQERVDPSRR